MNTHFDGLRSILGDANAGLFSAGTPMNSDARDPRPDAAEEVLPATPVVPVPVEERPIAQATEPEPERPEPDGLEDLDLWLTSPPDRDAAGAMSIDVPLAEVPLATSPELPVAAVSDVAPPPGESLPGDDAELLELDRGVYDAGARPPEIAEAGLVASAASDLPDDLLDLDRGVYDPGQAPLASRLVLPAVQEDVVADAEISVPKRRRTAQAGTGGWLVVGVVLAGMMLGGGAALAVFHEQVSQVVTHWAPHPGARKGSF